MQRGLRLSGWGREECSRQAKRDARAGSGRDGEASAGHAECRRWGRAQGRLYRSTKRCAQKQRTLDSNTGFAFLGCETMDKLLNTSPSVSPHQESGDPPFSSLGNIVKIRIQTQSTSGTSDKEKMYSESYSDTGIKPPSGQNHPGSQKEAWGQVRKHQMWGMEVSTG